MNKRLNTILFVLGATAFQVIVAVASFILLVILYGRFLVPIIPESSYNWSFALLFIGALAISFFTYNIAIKFLIKKIDIDKYFDPIFMRRYKKPNIQ